MSLTISQARKALGKTGKVLSDQQIKEELEVASFLAELLLENYKITKKRPKIERGYAESSNLR